MGLKEPGMAIPHKGPALDVSYREKPTVPNIAADQVKKKAIGPAAEVQNWSMRKILEHEGYRANPYKDTRKKLTGGIGHLMTKEDFKNFDYDWDDKKKSEYWMSRFKEDYGRSSRAAIALMNKYEIEPNEVHQFVLTDMAFNLGPNGLASFKNFLQDLGSGNTEGAILEMKRVSKYSSEPSDWYKQVPERVESLIALLRSPNESS